MKTVDSSLESVLKDRAVIPRWRSPQLAIETVSSSIATLDRRRAASRRWVQHLIATFEQFSSPQTATELYETAQLLGCLELVPEYARSLSRDSSTMEEAALRLTAPQAPQLAGCAADEFEDTARREIKRLRGQLAENPIRPYSWSELARHFLAVGEQEKAIRAMQGALQLAKHNRYLLRAATRLFVHVDQPDRAVHILRSSPGIRGDPWLLAAEIAASSVAEKPSRFIDAGRQVLMSDQYTAMQLSELAAAIGTEEVTHGAIKRAKTQFAKSLIAPTENALAQAQWAIERDVKITIPDAAWNTPDSYEAKALLSRQHRNWNGTIAACGAWLAEEPFSVRPAIMGSYLGFFPEFHVIAEEFASIGLKSDSGNAMLLNNRAVVRAYQGNVIEAYRDLKQALQNEYARKDPHLLATLGLIAFRSGMPNLGREYYSRCISWFSCAKEKASIASAILHLLKEELRVDKSIVPQAIELSAQIAKLPALQRHPELIGLAELIGQMAMHREVAPSEVGSNTLPGSPDDFRYQAALFDVPPEAEKRLSRLVTEYRSLL